MVTLEELESAQGEDDTIDMEILQSSTADIVNRTKLLDNDIKVMRSESQRLTHEKTMMLERIKDNQNKINNKNHSRNKIETQLTHQIKSRLLGIGFVVCYSSSREPVVTVTAHIVGKQT